MLHLFSMQRNPGRCSDMVDILLATYNGGQYLPDLFDSLFAQTYEEFRILTLDDQSTDQTPDIVRQASKAHEGRIRILHSAAHSGDPAGNFFRLLEASSGDYVMFCDQDDIWCSDKILESLRAMQLREENDATIPVLVHTDLTVVDRNLRMLAPSFVRMENLDPTWTQLPRLIAQNNVTGCTVLFNAHLRRVLRKPPRGVMHDWWTALTASAFGDIVYLDKSTVLYRQHGENAVGAVHASGLPYILEKLFHPRDMQNSIRSSYECARLFASVYRDLLSAQQLSFLHEYSDLEKATDRARFRFLQKHHAYKKGLARKVAQIWYGGKKEMHKTV